MNEKKQNEYHAEVVKYLTGLIKQINNGEILLVEFSKEVGIRENTYPDDFLGCREFEPDGSFELTLRFVQGRPAESKAESKAEQFLNKLAELCVEYGPHFYYTNCDDGIHIELDGVDCFADYPISAETIQRAVTARRGR